MLVAAGQEGNPSRAVLNECRKERKHLRLDVLKSDTWYVESISLSILLRRVEETMPTVPIRHFGPFR